MLIERAAQREGGRHVAVSTDVMSILFKCKL